MSLRYFNVTTWEATSLNPRIKTTNFKLTMDIIYRESMLLKLFDTVEMLDRKYWQYCIDRITAMENLKPLAIEPLVAQRNKIFLLQKELSVIIAHVRGVSVSLMKNLTKVRKLFAEEARTDIPVSVFWKNDNYLLKMQNDWSALYNYQSIRFWLGFSPNPFMLPPAEHDPKKVWRSHRDELLKEWQKKRKTILFAPTNSSNGRNSNSNSMGARRNAQATVRTTLLMSTIKDLSKQDETGDGGVTISFTEPDASSNFNSNSVLDKSEVKVIRPLLKKSSTVGFIESSTSSDVDKFQNLELPINSVESSKKIVFDKFSSGISSGRSSRHSSRPSSRESSRPGSARPGDTDINNSNFLPSLPFKEEQSVDTDETSEYEAEWEELRKFCWRSWDDNQLEQSAERAGQFWTNYDHKPIAVEAALGFEEVFPKNFLVPPLPTELLSKCVKYENVIMQESMRYEQTVQLQENCRTKKEEHSSMLASQSLENFGSLEFISQSILQLDQLKTRQQGSTELLTSTSKFGSSTVLPGNSWSKISNDNVFITDTTNVGEMSGSSSLIINMNSSKTRKRIEEKVSAARSAVDSASFIKKHAKPHYTSEKWYHYHAILIQALIRGFRARTRVKELRFQRNIDDAVLKLQCFFRVVKAHRILRSKLQRIKLETLVLRRKALVKYKAAIIITNYIRNAVNKQRKRNNEPLLRSKYRRRVKKRGSILCSPSIAASPELNFDSKRFLPVLTDEVSTARTVETYSSTSVDSLDEPTFEEPKIPSNTFSFFDTLAQLSSSVAVPLDPTDNQKIYFDANSLTSDYKEMSDKESTLMTAFDESQRQAEEKASAIAFVKRINEGKITIDDRNTSRLIPLKTIIVNRSYRKIKQLSRKEYTFLSLSGNSGNGVVSGSLDANNTVTSVANGRPRPTLFSTSEAYLGPIPNSTVLSRQAEAARRNLLLSRSIPDDSLVDGQEGILSHKTRHTALDRNLNDTKSIKRLLKNYY